MPKTTESSDIPLSGQTPLSPPITVSAASLFELESAAIRSVNQRIERMLAFIFQMVFTLSFVYMLPSKYWFFTALVFFVLAAFATSGYLKVRTRLQISQIEREQANLLVAPEVTSLVDRLARLSIRSDKTVSRLAQQHLAELLPGIKEADFNLLSQDQRQNLYNILSGTRRERRPYSNALLIAILDLLARTGDTRALPLVESFAKRIHPDPVQTAAETCLTTLREYSARQKQGDTLLRPSEDGGVTLLRPAAGTETDADVLLRIPSENK